MIKSCALNLGVGTRSAHKIYCWKKFRKRKLKNNRQTWKCYVRGECGWNTFGLELWFVHPVVKRVIKIKQLINHKYLYSYLIFYTTCCIHLWLSSGILSHKVHWGRNNSNTNFKDISVTLLLKLQLYWMFLAAFCNLIYLMMAKMPKHVLYNYK